MPVSPVGPENPLPPLTRPADPHSDVDVTAGDAELRGNAGYGHVTSVLPYRLQDGYSREPVPTDLRVAVLENDILRATFLLDLGGRLWSLVHLPSGRELLHRSPVLQPANLGVRNAWFAGGVEWNIGTTGHSPLTCAPLHAARVSGPGGSPMLRLYEFERMRQLVFMLDAWLPPGSPMLFVAVRISNPTTGTVPVYWWSNTAVPETERTRVLAPATQAYHFGYERRLRIVDVAEHGGRDTSYPGHAPQAGDWFYDCRPRRYPWIAAPDGQGQGLVQVSTPRLRGRKLFVWGQSVGGRHWQSFLGGDGHPYLEIQAGLARTQLEHEPLAAGAQVSWAEGYGFLQADPAAVHGPWEQARAGVETALETLAPGSTMDRALAEAEGLAATPPDEVLHHGSGWGALENGRRAQQGEPPLTGVGTPFSPETIGPEQAPWVSLLATGRLAPDDPMRPPHSYVVGQGWADLLEAATDTWASWLHRGVVRWHAGDRAGATAAAEQSLRCEENPWALRNLAVSALTSGDAVKAAGLLRRAHHQLPTLRPLTIELLAALLQADLSGEALDVIDGLPVADRTHGRIRLLELRSALASRRLDRAEGILMDESLVVQDIGEGEDSLDSLWWAYHDSCAEEAAGGPLTSTQRARVRRENPLPHRLDFRMDGS